MIRTDFGLNYTQAGLIVSAFAITSGISQLPAGWFADHFGTRVTVAIGVSGVAVAGLLIGFSNSYVSLIILLIFAAILGGAYHPASATAVSSLVPPERRGRALGLHAIGGSSCFWVVPLLAAPIALAWGWRGVYIALTIPAIVLGIVLYILIGKRTQMPARQPNKNGMVTEVAKSQTKIRWRQLAPFLIITVATATIIHSIIAYLSLYAVDYFGITESAAAMLVAIIPAVALFAAPLGGYLYDRFGGMPVLISVSLLAAPFIYLMGIVPNIFTLALVMAAVGVINYIRMPASEAYIIGHVPQYRRATILGVYFFASMEISGLLAPVIGNLIDRLGFYWSFTIASAALAAIVLVCSLLLWRTEILNKNS